MSSVVRQKRKSQNGGNKKIKHAKCSVNRTFLSPKYAHLRPCIPTIYQPAAVLP